MTRNASMIARVDEKEIRETFANLLLNTAKRTKITTGDTDDA